MGDRAMPPRPNVVLFLASDLGYGDLGCFGHPSHRTPNVDRLAREGVRFTDFHSNGPMCSPSRAALLTGMYQQRVGVEFVLNHHARDFPPMDPSARTFGHALREAGYATGFFGSHHTGYLPDHSPLRLGFDEFVGLCGGMDHHSHVTRWGRPNWWHGERLVEEKGYASDLIADHAMRFIEKHRDRPFCVHVADFAVHFPWQGPGDPAVFLPGANHDTAERKYGARPDRATVYREMVEAMDRNVGRLLDHLARLGLDGNTLFLFSSDHGGHHMVANNHPLSGAKGSLREGGHRVPTLARWPGVLRPGRTIEDPLVLMDLFPTFCDLCGAPAPAGLDGASLQSLLAGGKPPEERTLFWRMGDLKAARRGPWKLLVEEGRARLFDLASDLAEARDLSAARPEVAARLQAELARWEAAVPPAPSPRAAR
jgi:arylsulfatase A-like enzyme